MNQQKLLTLLRTAEREAEHWEEQFELANSPLQWRAALVAREFALQWASYWRACVAHGKTPCIGVQYG
ncbi:hypothetical protein P3102_07600 [Amycolatopsis sp. QT-25]|uniref:hypothetical protein n=1 Tax=Amycolatopsis sp. QT-25 TaxID=3034022 RepID=UPI0023EAB63F|nr:hypothetical protein [Amycolatopsis sp. QT-25]WET81081.1 hypothetical protein P3102_07600 [Amycolatopsis sp. QT-25]